MKRALGALAAGLVLAMAGPAAATRPYIPHELPQWHVRQSAKVGRHASAGAVVMRRYGDALPRVIHTSLGTSDDPRDVSGFGSAIRAVMRVAGGGRCVVWANIVRPPVCARFAAIRTGSRATACVSAEGYAARAHAVASVVRRCA